MNFRLLFFGSVILMFSLLGNQLSAQDQPFSLSNSTAQSFEEINDAANAFFASEPTSAENDEDNDFLRFKRWQWYWKDRVMPDGSFPDLMTQKRIFDDLCSENITGSRDFTSPWTNIGQTQASGGYNGMGRATSVAFHPTDPDIFYVGAPKGGIWRTMDGGLTYAALGDSLPFVSVGNICVDHQNPNIIYITVGDHNGWWKYGLGVFKSIDAGLTWLPTANLVSFTNSIAFYKMVMNPYNSEELFVAQSNGLYRTQDGGETWDVVHTDAQSDVLFQPGSDTNLYCATDDYWGNSEVYMSYDNGDNWQQISDFGVSGNNLKLTVSPANDQYLGIQSSVDGAADFYLSYDGGLNVFEYSFMPEDGVVLFSPDDVETIYCGFMVVNRSVDGGFQWDQITNWWNSGDYDVVHADSRYMTFHPITHELFLCNDGGVYKYNEANEQWTELSSGLVITQFYRIAVSQQDDVFMIGGTQDNGGRKRVAPGSWQRTNGGDAMEVAINQDDDQVIYTTYTYGTLYRSYDQWNDDTGFEITPPQTTGGDWVTPYVLNPSDGSVIVAGYEDVFISYSQGNSWTQLSFDLTGSPDNKLQAIAVAPSDENVIYASRESTLYYTLDGGSTWESEVIMFGATNGARATSIVVHPTDPLKLWITISGYATGKKVYYSENAGVTFTNVSYNLPNVPINSSVIDKESPYFDLYIGSDVGVFVLNMVENSWIYYGVGMPNTSVTDLEIQYSSRKLRAATYGRGIWENDLLSEPGVSVFTHDNLTKTHFDLLHNPVGEMLVLNVHTSVNWKGSFMVYSMDGKIMGSENRSLPMGNYQLYMSVSDLPAGMYLLSYESATGALPALKFIKE